MKLLPQYKPDAKSVARPAPERGGNAWFGPRRRARRLWISPTASLSLFLLCASGAANGQDATSPTAGNTASPASNGASAPASSLSGLTLNSAVWRTRVSLKVRDAPLAQVLSLLENMAPVRFRYGALPDAVVSADLRDVALLPALEYLLRGVSWQTRSADTDIFLLRRQTPEEVAAQNADRSPSPGNASPENSALPVPAPGMSAATLFPSSMAAVAGWRYWSGVQPPARRWMTMEEPKNSASSGANIAASKDNLRTAEPSDKSIFWRAAAISVEAQRRPGIRVLLPSVPVPMPMLAVPVQPEEATAGRAQPVASVAGQRPVWLRWRMHLSFVPRDARLLLETPVVATLYVNGAPLLSHWSGMRLVDLSNVLHRGDNVLALHWLSVPREMMSASGASASGASASASANAAGDETSAPTLLRYEWLCDPFGGTVTSEGG